MESNRNNRVFTEDEEQILRELRLDYRDAYDAIKLATSRKKRTLKKIYINIEECNTCMNSDCAICMTKHNMRDVCFVDCGHQFGSLCLAQWKNNTCPLCRTMITTVTEFKTPSLFDLVLSYKFN